MVLSSNHSGLALAPFALDAPFRIGRLSCAALGRPAMPELVLPHGSVSRDHASVESTETGMVLQDGDSVNGTFVNGFRLGAFPIKLGDHIRVGTLEFSILAVDVDRYAGRFSDTDGSMPAVGSRAWTTGYSPHKSERHRSDEHTGVHFALSSPGSLPNSWINACQFGVIIVREYGHFLTENLSDVGVIRWERDLGRLVGQRLDASTFAMRILEEGMLRIVLASRLERGLEKLLPDVVCELERQIFDISLKHYTIPHAISNVDPGVALKRALRAQGRTAEFEREFRWVHISDLHFGAGTANWRFDHEQVMASLIRDLKKDKFMADRILVTGDVAYSGDPAQYLSAREALIGISSAADCSLASVRVVPGNHDVERRISKSPVPTALHLHARFSRDALDEMFVDPLARAQLIAKLANFQTFVSGLDGHPPELDWRERISIGGKDVDLWGLNSVWVSDEMDGRDERGTFIANLVIGKSQYRQQLRDVHPAELNIVMTHHPLDWILPEHGRWLRSAFASVPSVHLCGHVHKQAGTAVVRLGKKNNSITLVAGASHAEQNEPVTHSYSRCVLHCDEFARWRLGWSPRIYDIERDEFRVDRSHDVDVDGYIWVSFPVPGPVITLGRQ